MAIQHRYTKENEQLGDLSALPLKTLSSGMSVFKYQSPINFEAAEEVIGEPELDLLLCYTSDTFTQEIFGGAYHLVPQKKDNHITFEGQRFDLVDIHVHFPSEHTIDGHATQFEFHVVHESAEGENLVIGILYETVKKKFIKGNPIRHDKMRELFLEKEEVSFNPQDYIPMPLSYYHFVGSLTTPPYNGPVLWFMMDEIQFADESIIDQVMGMVPINNNRQVFPIQDRLIYHN